MSRSTTVQTSTEALPGGLALAILGGAAAVTGAVVAGAVVAGAAHLTISASRVVISQLREALAAVRRGDFACREPLLSFTPLTNLTGYQETLQAEGFSLRQEGKLIQATRPDGATLHLVGTDGGIGVFSGDKGLLETVQQGFVVREVSRVLEETGYRVAVEQAEYGKSIAATVGREAKPAVVVEVDARGAVVKVDTKREKRPRCDVVHQLVRQRLDGSRPVGPSRQPRRRERLPIHVTRQGGRG
jgi:hypothetical protein